MREFELIKPVPVAPRSGIAHLYKPMNLSDAFAIRLPAGTSSDPDLLARFIISNQPSCHASNRQKIMSIDSPDLIALWERGVGVCREWANWSR